MSFRLSRFLRSRYAEWYRGLTPKGGFRGRMGHWGRVRPPSMQTNIIKYLFNIIKNQH